MSINALKSEVHLNLVPTSQKTQSVSITKISELMLYREVVAVYMYWENYCTQIHFVGKCTVLM